MLQDAPDQAPNRLEVVHHEYREARHCDPEKRRYGLKRSSVRGDDLGRGTLDDARGHGG
jgi:hypothetical protein